MTRSRAPVPLLVWALVAFAGAAWPAGAQEMPDPSLIHGRAIPAGELPDGTVTVRVVREALGNNVAGQDVRVTAGDSSASATTDDLGRAEFGDLPRGSQATAEVTVDGETLVSEPFVVPTAGGLRVILVAGLARVAERRAAEEAAAAAAPVQAGIVVVGGESRILMEFNDEALDVYYVFDIVNSARARVDTGGPLVIELPAGATGATALEGSSPAATVSSDRITVAGPFASGTTPVQVAFRMPHDTPVLTLSLTLPVPMQEVLVGVEQVGGLTLSSPQFAQVGEVPTGDGLFLLGSGPALPAGETLAITLTGLPVHSRTPRYVALALALGLAALGVWLSVSGRAGRAQQRQALEARRDTLLGQLTQLESRRRAGSVDGETYARRRRRLVDELERIYGELDEAGAGPRGGGEGVAA